MGVLVANVEVLFGVQLLGSDAEPSSVDSLQQLHHFLRVTCQSHIHEAIANVDGILIKSAVHEVEIEKHIGLSRIIDVADLAVIDVKCLLLYHHVDCMRQAPEVVGIDKFVLVDKLKIVPWRAKLVSVSLSHSSKMIMITWLLWYNINQVALVATNESDSQSVQNSRTRYCPSHDHHLLIQNRLELLPLHVCRHHLLPIYGQIRRSQSRHLPETL